MSSQVISYRLSTDEVISLRQKALPGESDNQTAQRLMREVLGVSTELSTTSTPNLDERIESIVEERLSGFAAIQNVLLNRLQERLQQIELRLEESLARAEVQSQTPVDSVGEAVDDADGITDTTVDSVDDTVDKTGDRLLSGADLAKRLGVNPGTLSKNRAKPKFIEWSRGKDPEQLAWRYVSEVERYTPVLSTGLSTSVDMDEDLVGDRWKARVDEAVSSL